MRQWPLLYNPNAKAPFWLHENYRDASWFRSTTQINNPDPTMIAAPNRTFIVGISANTKNPQSVLKTKLLYPKGARNDASPLDRDRIIKYWPNPPQTPIPNINALV